MSVVYKGQVLDTSLTRGAMGGTEQMRARFLKYVDPVLVGQVAVHFSRPQTIYTDVPNILYCHDLANDEAVSSLRHTTDQYDHFVFVSYWQRDQFIDMFGMPHSKCTVIRNAIETTYDQSLRKDVGQIKFIYHTTPHRGLELVYPIFDRLSELHDNIHLDVFSSFSVYGWENRDKPYANLFQRIADHPHMTYHGAKSNREVLDALRSAHVFLYPSIWKETSCIALIEAMSAGCLAIYPSYGALPETGSMTSNVNMYEYTEDVSVNASRALSISNWVLERQKADPEFIRTLSLSSTQQHSPHTIDTYANDWRSVLMSVINP